MQCAHAAAKTKRSYLGARYKRIAYRRGKGKAIIAVGHSMLQAIYYMLKYGMPYQDLGADYYDKLNRQSSIRYHLSRLTQLGVQLPTGQTPYCQSTLAAN